MKQVLLGDNLKHLKDMPSNSVDLVATDPPYNSGRDYYDVNGRFSDHFGNPKELEEETSIIQTANRNLHEYILSLPPTSSRWHTVFMSARLLHLERVLKPTGSIFVQCDDSANAHLRIALDIIFGTGNRRNEIIWKRRTVKQTDSTAKFGRVCDHILFYVKSDRATFRPIYGWYDPEYIASKFKHDDGDGRGKYQRTSIIKNRIDRPNLEYEFQGQHCKWTISKDEMQRRWDDNRVGQDSKTGVIYNKLYLSDAKGVAVNSLWDDIKPLSPRSPEKIDYPTQKPVALYRRIILCASVEGDIVLDPFGGSGTTAVAAMRTERGFIMIEEQKEYIALIHQRLEHEANAIDGSALEIHPTQAPREKVELMYQPDILTCAPPVKDEFVLSDEAGNAPATLSNDDKMEILHRQGGCCNACGGTFENYQYDHRLAKQFGGTNDRRNLQGLCYDCHLFKTQWERKHGRPIDHDWFCETRRKMRIDAQTEQGNRTKC